MSDTSATRRYAVLVVGLGVYAALVVGGFLLVFRAMQWVDAAFVQPAVGGNEAVSLLLFFGAQAGYVYAVYWLTTTDHVRGGESDEYATWNDNDRGGFLK